MTKKELALEYHKKGYNCTQAVACAFCGEFGVSEEEMYKIAEGFGLGMGMMDTLSLIHISISHTAATVSARQSWL